MTHRIKRLSCHLFAYKSLLVLLIGAVLAGSVYAVYRRKIVIPSAETNSAATSTISATEDLEVELINVLPNGFEPGEITRPAGRFVLVFDNQSRLQPLEFRVERTTGTAVITALPHRGKTLSTDVLNLPPGEYRVTEASHPDWNLKLTLIKR